jgi:hypothetical protein
MVSAGANRWGFPNVHSTCVVARFQISAPDSSMIRTWGMQVPVGTLHGESAVFRTETVSTTRSPGE